MIIKRASTWQTKIGSVLLGFAVTFIWVTIVTELLKAVGMWEPTTHEVHNLTDFTRVILFGCFIHPLWEEAAFRYAPLTFASLVPGDKAIWPVIIISATIFGLGHGSGSISILVQGVMGVILSLVYLRSGYWAAVALHTLWNLHTLFYP